MVGCSGTIENMQERISFYSGNSIVYITVMWGHGVDVFSCPTMDT